MKKQNTKTQLTVTEKMELLESRTKKFAQWYRMAYMREKPAMAKENIRLVQEIWDEIVEQIENDLNEAPGESSSRI